MKTLVSRMLSLAALGGLVACSTPVAPRPPQSTAAPAVAERARAPVHVRLGLALGGGAAKGFAHIGVIRVLEANGIVPDLVTGTSAGSVVGSLYASGMNGTELLKRAKNLDESSLADFTFSTRGIIKGQKLADFINAQVGNRPLEKLAKPFGVVATELDTGRRVVFRIGNTGQAVRASASIPNVFLPTVIGGKRYVDGGLVSPVPVSAAREMGAEFVIAVDISARPRAGTATGYLSTLDQSVNIMSAAALAQELKQADVVIRPQVQNIGSTSFDARNQAIAAGEKAAQQAVPIIRRLLLLKAQAMAR